MISTNQKLIALIGAMKSGTSNLHSLLSTHPDIDGGKNKEGNFFVHNNLKGFEGNYTQRTSTYLLDGSTAYSKPGQNVAAAENIKAALGRVFSDVYIIYIVRDPIERIISQVNYMANNPQWGTPSFSHTGRVISDYHEMLAPYVRLFSKEKILILTFEEFKSNENQVLDKCARFLKVPNQFNLNLSNQHKTDTKGILERMLLTRFQSTIHMVSPSLRNRGKKILRFISKPQKLQPSESQLIDIHLQIRQSILTFLDENNIDISVWPLFNHFEQNFSTKRDRK